MGYKHPEVLVSTDWIAEHGDDPGLGTEMARVASEVKQRVGSGAEEQSVDQSRTEQGQAVQRVRQREDHVHVVDGQQLRVAVVQPALRGQGLALRAVAIATRAPQHPLVAAVGTGLADTTQSGSAAAFDRS